MDHPEYFVPGTEVDLEQSPQNYKRVKSRRGDSILAYGRDPYFSGWPDTVQLDYCNPATTEAMSQELLRISGQCDGVRCDMAMLVLPEVIEKTWGHSAQPFWPIIIKAVREKVPGFCFMAEVYWDMEWTLQQQGFDYTYDKQLYDRLRDGSASAVREHFYADKNYQDKLVRFLENHDEARVASIFDQKRHEAAAVITFFSPGLRFFHQGQFEGRRKKVSPHLVRRPQEPLDIAVRQFYAELLGLLKQPVLRDGRWQLVNCTPAWEGNDTWDSFITFVWDDTGGGQMLVCVNYAPHASQCFVQLPFTGLAGQLVQFRDIMNDAIYDRDGNDLLERGLFLDMPEWGFHVFEVSNL